MARQGGKRRQGRGRGGTGSLQRFLDQWFAQSPSLAVGLFCTLPLWLLYEWAQWFYGDRLPENGAEAAILHVFGAMGPVGRDLMRISAGALVLGGVALLLHRRVPLFRVGGLVILEGIAWG